MRRDSVTYEQALVKINSKTGGSYVFASLVELSPDVEPMALIREQEGVTVALSSGNAQETRLSLQELYTIITLSAPGSLDVVGLNSGISQVLLIRSILSSIFSGIYYTHTLVPSGRVEETKALFDGASGQARVRMNH